MLDPLDLDVDPRAFLAAHSVLDEPVADALLTEREREVRALAREVVAHQVAPLAARLDRTAEFAHEGVQALARAGLAGLVFPESLGGSGDTNVAYAAAIEEVAAGCAATSLVLMTQMHAAYPITLAGSSELQQRYVPGLLDGSRYGALGITEPGAGSDVASIATTATRIGGGWRLSGQKTFITTGDKADVIVCFATVARGSGRESISAFVVDGGWSGVGRGQPFHKMGMHGSSTAELFLDGVEVPDSHVLGDIGQGWQVMMSSVVKSRISAAAQGVGIARAAYARTLSVLDRVHGGRWPEEAAAALAGLRTRILQGRLLLLATARRVDTDPAITPGQIGMMKQSCTDLGFETAVEAARILGPYGDLAVFGVERCLRDAKVTQIYDGTNEVQRLLVGRETARAWKERQ